MPRATCRRSRGSWPALALAAVALCLLPHAARAGLGEPAASVTADALKLQATLGSRASSAHYVVQAMQTPPGTTIREYVSNSGTVFAVAWNGPFKPDMTVLLGQFLDRYAQASRTSDSTRAHLRIEQPDLVVQASGSGRFFAGLAYAPQLLPGGVSPGELR
jgi:hypothetical protein